MNIPYHLNILFLECRTANTAAYLDAVAGSLALEWPQYQLPFFI
jgi:hypothetical protein